MIYFIQSGNYIKIGYTKNVESRIKALQTASPHSLNVVLTMPGGLRKEAELHSLFSHLKVRGEWFNATSELLNFVRHKVGCSRSCLRLKAALIPGKVVRMNPHQTHEKRLHVVYPVPDDLRSHLLVKIDDVAKLFGLKVQTVRNMLSQGRFPLEPKKMGKSVRFRVDDILKYAENS